MTGLALGLNEFSYQYALHTLVAAPGSWPAGRVFGWLYNSLWVIPSHRARVLVFAVSDRADLAGAVQQALEPAHLSVWPLARPA